MYSNLFFIQCIYTYIYAHYLCMRNCSFERWFRFRTRALALAPSLLLSPALALGIRISGSVSVFDCVYVSVDSRARSRGQFSRSQCSFGRLWLSCPSAQTFHLVAVTKYLVIVSFSLSFSLTRLFCFRTCLFIYLAVFGLFRLSVVFPIVLISWPFLRVFDLTHKCNDLWQQPDNWYIKLTIAFNNKWMKYY